jgi:pimeloyl-ACP methyl ester carboxylesterase
MSDRAKTDREAGYWDRIGEINVPVLILWGEHDVTTPVAFAHAFNDAIEQTTLKIYPNAAHLPMEEIPLDVARDIRSWIGTTFGPKESP